MNHVNKAKTVGNTYAPQLQQYTTYKNERHTSTCKEYVTSYSVWLALQIQAIQAAVRVCGVSAVPVYSNMPNKASK